MEGLKKSGKQPNMRDVQAFMMKRMGTLFKDMDLGAMGGGQGGGARSSSSSTGPSS